MSEIAKILIVIGVVFIGIGMLLLLAGKIPNLGKLPGDIVIKRDNFSVYIPLMSCLLLSVLLSLLFWFVYKK